MRRIMEGFVIITSIGIINKADEFEEIRETERIISKRIDTFFMRKINKLFKIKGTSNKIHIEDLS